MPRTSLPLHEGSSAVRLNDPHDTNNFKILFLRNGLLQYFCHGSHCQEQFQSNPAVVGRWDGLDKFAFREDGTLARPMATPLPLRFDEHTFHVLEAQWHFEKDKKKKDQDADTLCRLAADMDAVLNRFFVVVKAGKPEVMELFYDDKDRVCNFIRREVSKHWGLYPSTYMRKAWFLSGNRRTVDQLVFEVNPEKVGADQFNTFLGLEIERKFDIPNMTLDTSRCAAILELVTDVLASGVARHAEYMHKWAAYPLQTLKKTGVLLLLISPQGYGKSSWADDLLGKRIYGEKHGLHGGAYVQLNNMDDFVGRFNSLSSFTWYINLDEPSSLGSMYKQSNMVKNLLTARTRKVEMKGLEPIVVNDPTSYCMTCNPDTMRGDSQVRVETSDRRNAVFRLNGAAKTKEFFAKLHHEISRARGRLITTSTLWGWT